MKVLIINSFFSAGGPPRIVKGIYDLLEKSGHEVLLAASREKPIESMNTVKIGTSLDTYGHYAATRLGDRHGLASVGATKNLIKQIDRYDPDIVNLHNLHGYYLNYELLFRYFESKKKPVVWTLHDCWAFTGHCAHFDYVKCDRWEKGCHHCPQKMCYPKSVLIDNSEKNYARKKAAFTHLGGLSIITPSNWLEERVKQSFLGCYPIKTIHNGIDLDAFAPLEGSFKKSYRIERKKTILGVAQVWNERKGMKTFFELSKRLGADFQIIMVGLSDKQLRNLPLGILGIKRTTSIRELAEIYTGVDVFVNPTLEDTFPTVNLEALACGTPVVTYDSGGSPESLDNTCGLVVERDDLNSLERAVRTVCRSANFNRKNCVERAHLFSKEKAYCEYVSYMEKLASK